MSGQAEVDAVFSACGGAPSPRDLASLRHLELCVREALRLYPSIPVMSRRLGGTTHTNIDGYQVITRLISSSSSSYIAQVPPGTNVILLTYHLHRDPAQFGATAHQFRPERAAAERRDNYCYVPFSAGPRNCIGQRWEGSPVV